MMYLQLGDRQRERPFCGGCSVGTGRKCAAPFDWLVCESKLTKTLLSKHRVTVTDTLGLGLGLESGEGLGR